MRKKNATLAVWAVGMCASLLQLTSCTTKPRSEVDHLTQNKEERKKLNDLHQSGADKQLQGWFWSKGYPNPENLGQKYMAAWEEHLALKENTEKIFAANNQRTSVYGSWSTVGTSVANIGGRVLCLTIAPKYNDTIFVGTASGGIYKSYNAGSTWTYVPTGHAVLGVGAISFHPKNRNILLAGTGEVYRIEGTTDRGNMGFNVWKCRGTYGIGILRSADGGTTWTNVMPKISSNLFAIQDIAFHPTDSSVVFAAATDGVYKSTDCGLTWSSTPIIAKTYVRDIEINEANPNQMVISVGNLSNAEKAIYRSTDGGATFAASTGIVTGTGYIKFTSKGSRLYAAVGVGSGDELYMSSDFGGTWYRKTGSTHCGGQYWFAHSLSVDPTNTNRVIMGGVQYFTYTSSNGTTGGSRSVAQHASMHGDVHDIVFDTAQPTRVYVANDGGMYKSIDGGTSFGAINSGLNAVQFYANFAVSPTSANTMIGGLQDNGVVRTTDGVNWTAILGGDGGPSMFHPYDGNKVLYSNDARAVFFSTNAGGAETQFMKNLGYGFADAHDDRTSFMSPVGMSYPTATSRLAMYAASDNWHVSLDSGTSPGTNPKWFSKRDPAHMTRPIDMTYKPAIALAVSYADRNIAYVSTSPLSQKADDGLHVNIPARVMRTANATDSVGYVFSDISGTLPDRMTTDFAISKNDHDSVYITMGGFGGGHVYLSPNGGATWINRSAGLPDVPFNAIVIDPVRPSVIYAGCDFGVYVSHNRGVNWYYFSNGLPEYTMVMDLQISADKKLVAATHGKGVFRSNLFVPVATLPLTFESFTATKTNSGNELAWEVSREQDIKRYEVEQSTDGVHYRRIGTVSARSSGTYNRYGLTDRSAEAGAPIVYYRIKSFDGASTFFYSDVVSIKNSQAKGFAILGNPFQNTVQFRLTTTGGGPMQITLLNVAGRTIRSERQNAIAGTQVYRLSNLDVLARGQYFLQVQAGQERFVEKLSKQ